jgi:hypothetical protein
MIANLRDEELVRKYSGRKETDRAALIRCITELCPLLDDKTLCSIAREVLLVVWTVPRSARLSPSLGGRMGIRRHCPPKLGGQHERHAASAGGLLRRFLYQLPRGEGPAPFFS